VIKQSWCHSKNSDGVSFLELDYKGFTFFWQWRRQSLSSNPQSDTSSKEHFKIELKTLFTIGSSSLTIVRELQHCKSTWRQYSKYFWLANTCMPPYGPFVFQAAKNHTFCIIEDQSEFQPIHKLWPFTNWTEQCASFDNLTSWGPSMQPCQVRYLIPPDKGNHTIKIV